MAFGPNFGEDLKKNFFSQILSVFVLKLSAQLTKRGAVPQFYMLFYANYTTLATQRGGPWLHGPPKYAPNNITGKVNKKDKQKRRVALVTFQTLLQAIY